MPLQPILHHRVYSRLVIIMAFVITVILFVAVYWPMFVRPPQFCVQKEFVSEEGERLGYPHDFGKQEIFAHPEGGLVYNFVHGKERINKPFHPLETLLTIRKVYKNNDPSNQYCYVYPDANYWYTLYRLSRAKYSPFKAPQSAEYSAQLPRIESCIRALREVNSGLNVSVDDFVYDEQTKGWDIRLFGKALRNIEPLRGFPNVRVLVLANCEVEDLSIVATLQQLDCLVLYNMPKLVDISPLASSGDLTHLLLIGTAVKDLRPLQNLHKLREFDGTGNANLTDISPLAECHSLYRLYLEATPVYDIAPLAHCLELESINLDGTFVESISALPPSVKHLTIVNSRVRDISRLDALPNLSAFYFYNTPAYWRQVTCYVVIPGILVILAVAAITINKLQP